MAALPALGLLGPGGGLPAGGGLGLLAVLHGEQAPAAAQQQRQDQGDQLFSALRPGAPGAGALALPALRVAVGAAHRAGAQALAPLLDGRAGTGHMFFPSSGSVMFHWAFFLSLLPWMP